MRLLLALLASSLSLAAIEPTESEQLLCVKRIYVDRLDGDETSLQMRDMIISAIHRTHLFAVTENEERADAVLRGSSADLVFNDEHSSSDGVNANAHAGTGSTSYKGGSFNKSAGAGFGESESNRSSERKHEASAAVRLVTKEGDVIWSTTQESQGSKFKGSMADVADRIMRRLSDDMAKARALHDGAAPQKPKITPGNPN